MKTAAGGPGVRQGHAWGQLAGQWIFAFKVTFGTLKFQAWPSPNWQWPEDQPPGLSTGKDLEGTGASSPPEGEGQDDPGGQWSAQALGDGRVPSCPGPPFPAVPYNHCNT